MPKIGMEPLRRAATINATLECICEYGIDGVTLDLVATKAGFSKGIVSYYFKNKRAMILESLTAFLKSYKQKIKDSVRVDMSPLKMLQTILEVSLPALNEKSQQPINVLALNPHDNINLPEQKISKIFIQIISKASTDNELKKILRDVYTDDVKEIASLMGYIKMTMGLDGIDEYEEAYRLFSIIYGLSFFRVIGFLPEGKADNMQIALDYINTVFGIKKGKAEGE